MKKNFLFICVVLVFLISYFRVPFLFFQQDEIFGLAYFISEGKRVILSGLGAGDISHFVPVTMSLSYSLFTLFGLKYQVYNTLAILFHFLNGYLLYLIAKSYFEKKGAALVAVLIFFSSNAAAQLLMWPVINLNTLSLSFALLAWLAVLKKKLFWTPILFLLAVFSVEYSAGLALFIPLAIFLRVGKNVKEKIIKIIPFGLVVLAYSAFRFWPILSTQDGDLGILAGNKSSLVATVFKLVTKYFGQLFFGQGFLLSLSKLIQKAGGLSYLGDAYAEIGIFPVVSALAGLFLISGAVLFYKKIRKEKTYATNFLLTCAFILFSSLPFLLVPGGSGLSSIIASRYMYFGLAGSALAIAFIYEKATLYAKSKKFLINIALLFIVALGTAANFNQAKALYEQGAVRLDILNSIKISYRDLPEKVVFFAQSDTSYYGLPPEEKIFPFQSGLGQTLLLFYYEGEKFPKEFYPGDYLWEITSQGYREVGDRGFGFFRDRELLKKTLEDYKIPADAVIAFSWSGATEKLKDITGEIRKEVAK